MDGYEKIGSIPVDAGTVVVADPSFLMNGDDGVEVGLWDIYESVNETTDTMRDFVAVTSGLGDGCYPVYAKYVDVPGWGKRVAELRVVFIEDSEEAARFMNAIADAQAERMSKA